MATVNSAAAAESPPPMIDLTWLFHDMSITPIVPAGNRFQIPIGPFHTTVWHQSASFFAMILDRFKTKEALQELSPSVSRTSV